MGQVTAFGVSAITPFVEAQEQAGYHFRQNKGEKSPS
jgi:hypothetical protein